MRTHRNARHGINPFDAPHRIPTYREQLSRAIAQEGTMLKPVMRAHVRNALIDALAHEGVEVTPDKMDKALVRVVEGDPRPDNLPESIVVGGITLAWPRGRETRVPTAAERNAYNTALKHVESNEVLTDEHNVRLYREVYEALAYDVSDRPELSLPPLTVREIAQAKAVVEAETPPVIEHAVPTDVNVNALDAMLADLAQVVEQMS